MESPRVRRYRFFLPLLGAALFGLAACSTVSFYGQAARGQWEISGGAKPIGGILADPATPARLRERLQLVLELRRFAAEELKLPADSQYDRYCDLKRPFVVWVVYAAPEFSVEAKTWWYPLVGSLKYRGYFKEADARREAATLEKQGHDVFVTGTEAYSTLGWLRDPVLNTFLGRSDALLAELIFHELTHQRVYLSGDTDFNEAFATAVGEAGARHWLKARGRMDELKTYDAQKALQRSIITLILQTRERLASLYARHSGAPAEELRSLKKAELIRLRAEALRLRKETPSEKEIKGPRGRTLNNAALNSVAAYYTLLPGFERLLAEQGGDVPAFIARVADMKRLRKEERRALLLPPAP